MDESFSIEGLEDYIILSGGFRSDRPQLEVKLRLTDQQYEIIRSYGTIELPSTDVRVGICNAIGGKRQSIQVELVKPIAKMIQLVVEGSSYTADFTLDFIKLETRS